MKVCSNYKEKGENAKRAKGKKVLHESLLQL